MNILMRVVIAVVFILVSLPCQTFADGCSDYKEEAERIFKTAESEYGQKKFDEAIELYERAYRYYRSLSEMECTAEMNEYALKSVETCKKNIAYCEDNIKKQKKRAAEVEAVEQFNLATETFNEGLNFKKKRQWDEAEGAFKKAARIWTEIASGETEIGKKAKPRADKAREQADIAEKRNEAE